MTSQAKSKPVASQQTTCTLRSRVRESLRSHIHQGQWRLGERLPSETELMQAHAVSRITVRHALADLVSEGLIERIQGKGSYVASGAVHQDLSRLQGLTEALLPQGRRVHTQVLSLQRRNPTATIARHLRLQTSQVCMLLHTLRHVDDQPLSENHTWIRLEATQGWHVSALENVDLLTLYEQTLGLRVVRASIDIQAALATQAQCRRLQLRHPSAVLRVERTVFTFNDQALHHELSVYQPKAFSYRLSQNR